MKGKHSGVTLSGLLVSAVIVALLAVLGMKVVPEVIEYYLIVKAVKAVVKDENVQNSVADVRKAFDRYAQVDNIKSIEGRDLEITKDNGQVVVSFAYEKRIPLFGNVSLLIDFQGSSSGG